VSLILNVTGGTGTYAGATGTINLNGFIGAGAATIVGTASASIAYGTPVPTSPLDCLNGGWRNLANANGQPFKSAGQCVASIFRP